MIKTWEQRCEEHPDHQMGMVSHGMIQARMQEEIDDLRAALAQPEPFNPDWSRVKALEESLREHMAEIQRLKALAQREQEPVAWWDGKESVVFVHDEIYTPNWTDYWTRPLYTHPPQRLMAAAPEPVEESTLLALARRCLWIAYVWNDHNFVEAAHKYAKEEAEKHGIKSFEQSNDWLRSHPPQRKPMPDMAIERAYDELLSQPMREQDKRVIVNFARAIERAHGIGGEA